MIFTLHHLLRSHTFTAIRRDRKHSDRSHNNRHHRADRHDLFKKRKKEKNKYVARIEVCDITHSAIYVCVWDYKIWISTSKLINWIFIQVGAFCFVFHVDWLIIKCLSLNPFPLSRCLAFSFQRFFFFLRKLGAPDLWAYYTILRLCKHRHF